MQCQEGQLGIEGVSFYDDSSLAGDLTAEADWKRRGLFVGPQVNVNTFVIVMRRLMFFPLPILLCSLKL
jgi:Mitochondrial glycoprotein